MFFYKRVSSLRPKIILDTTPHPPRRPPMGHGNSGFMPRRFCLPKCAGRENESRHSDLRCDEEKSARKEERAREIENRAVRSLKRGDTVKKQKDRRRRRREKKRLKHQEELEGLRAEGGVEQEVTIRTPPPLPKPPVGRVDPRAFVPY